MCIVSSLVDSNVAVPSNRGSWGKRGEGDSNLHNAHYSKHYEVEDNEVQKSWVTRLEEDCGDTVKKKIKNLKDIKKYMSARKELEQMKDGVTGFSMKAEGDSNYQATYNRHYEGENELVKNCQIGEDDVVIPNNGSFSMKTQGPELNCDIADKEQQTGHTDIKLLKKKINTLKKKIKHFEDDFEIDFGHRPSQSEKRKEKKIRKYMSELSKAREELKQIQDGISGLNHISSAQKSTIPQSKPMLDQGSANAFSTLQQIEESLKEERSACGRRENISEMTSNELQEEKTALQKALLHYEDNHGRPETREDLDLAKPLYDRYRQCKRYVLRAGSRAKEHTGDLTPIIEHETMYFTLGDHRCMCQDEIDTKLYKTSTDEEDFSPNQSQKLDKGETITGQCFGNLHCLPLRELKNRRKESKNEKKQLQTALRNFEEQFEREYGRKFQKEDRGPMEQTYLDYKQSKAKLRLLKALLSKLEPTHY